jgi:hypothetical protein
MEQGSVSTSFFAGCWDGGGELGSERLKLTFLLGVRWFSFPEVLDLRESFRPRLALPLELVTDLCRSVL